MKRLLLTSLLGAVFLLASANDYEEHKEHHNRYELELSFNDAKHLEFTGSVYFLPKKKVQVTADQNFKHFASVVVQELPFEHSKWGTFFGAGVTYALHDSVHDGHVEHHNELAGIIQSGLAYAIDSHWSPGFTLSPGYSFTHANFVMGATLDIVYGF